MSDETLTTIDILFVGTHCHPPPIHRSTRQPPAHLRIANIDMAVQPAPGGNVVPQNIVHQPNQQQPQQMQQEEKGLPQRRYKRLWFGSVFVVICLLVWIFKVRVTLPSLP